jgi:predicted transposase YbfD/YdcC
MKEAAAKIGAQIISIDALSFNGSYDREKDQKSLHMVSAWVSSHHLLPNQVKTEKKSHEITAIPKLLRRYYLMPATAVEIPTGWPTIQRVVMVERERSDWKKTSYQVQYYICSLPADQEKISKAIRTDWGRENQLP